MGHVPSKEVCGKPFIADLQTAKGHVDRLIAVALTKDNFPCAEDPLFQQFVGLRCDPSVLHWFNVQDPAKRTSLPPPPSAQYLYEKHVQDTTDMIEKGNVGPGEFSPIPIALFRLVRGSKAQVLDQGSSTSRATLRDIIAAGEEVQIVGYLGCRGPNFKVGPILSVFLDKSFWNEAKSISIFQIGCKCYEHFASMINLPAPQWPTKLKARSLATNLPTLRLIQKICREYQEAMNTVAGIKVDHAENRVCLSADPETIHRICEHLAGSVSSETFPGTAIHRRFRLKTQCAVAAPATTPFDDIVEHAKKMWNESNQLVVTAKKEAAAVQVQAAAAQNRPTTPTPVDNASIGTAPGSNESSNTKLQRNKEKAAKVAAATNTTNGPMEMTPNRSPVAIAMAAAGTSSSSLTGSTQSNSITPPTAQWQPHPQLMAQQHSGPLAMIPNGTIPMTHSQQFRPQQPAQQQQQPFTQQAVPSPFGQHPQPMITPPKQQLPQQQAPVQVLARPMASAPPSQPPVMPPHRQEPKTIKLPFLTTATILLPTDQPGVLRPFTVQWTETDLALRPSSQKSQHPGMLLEVVKDSRGGSNIINTLNQGPLPVKTSLTVIDQGNQVTFTMPEPCYVNINPGSPVFVQF